MKPAIAIVALCLLAGCCERRYVFVEVVDENAKPFKDADVWATNKDTSGEVLATSNGDGTYILNMPAWWKRPVITRGVAGIPVVAASAGGCSSGATSVTR